MRISANRLMLLARRAWPYGESMGYAISLDDSINSLVQGNVIKRMKGVYRSVDAPRLLVKGSGNIIRNNRIVVQDFNHDGLPVVKSDESESVVSGNRFVSQEDDLIDWD